MVPIRSKMKMLCIYILFRQLVWLCRKLGVGGNVIMCFGAVLMVMCERVDSNIPHISISISMVKGTVML